jgi:sterol desaturase/sphingolipid hydroxylase (fatty acid hydroxylase superfamily)
MRVSAPANDRPRSGRADCLLPVLLPGALAILLLILAALLLAPELLASARAFGVKAVWRVVENGVSLVLMPLDHREKFGLVYFLISFALGAVLLARQEDEAGQRAGLLARLFPRAIYTHPSARLDYGLVLLNRVFTPAVLITRLLSSAWIAAAVGAALAALFGPAQPLAPGMYGLVLFTILFALTMDLADYLQHRLHHRVPLLWPFHRLHHSAEVLTPLTALRTHPVEQVVGSLVSTPLLGCVTGIAGYWLIDRPEPLTFFGAHFLLVFFYACCGVHLRHSHIWLSWPPALSHVLVSPAQHQVHHSRAPRHWNKNYGNVLAVWDWLFGSLYVPRDREALEIGLPEGQPHRTIIAAYFVPFADAARVISGRIRRPAAAPVDTEATAAQTGLGSP